VTTRRSAQATTTGKAASAVRRPAFLPRCITLACAFVLPALPLAAAPADAIRVTIAEQPNTLNPLLVAQFDENYVVEAIFSGLTVIDDRGRTQPDLAVTVPTRSNGGVSADGKTITYRLRPNARWHDGAAVTADDVVFTYRKMIDPKIPFPSRSTYDVVERVEARDPHTVVVRLRRPSPDAPDELFVNGQNGAIVPKHVLERVADIVHADYNASPIGSGPYRVERWDRGGALHLVANRDYFGGAPHVARLDVSVVPDTNTRAILARTHETDLVPIAASDAAAVGSATDMRVAAPVAPTLAYLMFRVDLPPFDDARVRRALGAVIDRSAIARTVYLGYAVPATDLLPPQSRFHLNVPVPAPDVRAAAKLLDEAGWKPSADGTRVRDGKRLSIALTTIANSAPILRTAVLLQAAWHGIGVEMTVRPQPTNLLYAPVTGTLAKGDFTVALTGFGFALTPDRTQNLCSAGFPPAGSNDGRYHDPDVDRWMSEARSSLDSSARKRLYAQIALRVQRDVPIVPIVWRKAVEAIADRVDGVRPEPVNSDFWNVTQWRLR